MPDAPRVRLASTVDLSKANPGCDRCNGTGVVGKVRLALSDDGSDEILVPKICACVTINGGIAKDMLDRIQEQTAQQLANGEYAEQLANEVQALPIHRRASAISKLAEQLRNERTDPQVKAAIEAALELLSKETHHGKALDQKI